VFTIVAVLILDKVGRRPLLMAGTAGCIVSPWVLGALFASGWAPRTSGPPEGVCTLTARHAGPFVTGN
jgi:sugar transport protein